MICKYCGRGIEYGDKIYLSGKINGSFCSDSCRIKAEKKEMKK